MKYIQKLIVEHILNKHEKFVFVFGFYKSENHIKNAEAHLKSKEMLNIDIKDFFGSINSKQVYFIFNKIFEFNSEVATVLTKLTTLKDSLPQGAPTSPMLSNLVFRNVDYRLNSLAEKMGIIYTRYADDLTFSSQVAFNKKYVYKKVEEILMENEFEINKKKTRFLSEHLHVTGLNIINEELKIPSYYIKEIKSDFYYINKFGLEDHVKVKFDNDKTVESYLDILYGKILYVYQVNKEVGKDLLNKFYKIL